MRHIAGFEECVTGLIDRRLVTFHVGELTGHYDADARTGMMVVANVSPGLVRDFGNAEFVLAIQIGNVPRENLL